MKKYFVGIFAAAIALSLSAFTAKSKYFSQTYSYTGTSFSHADVSNASNWKIGATPTPEDCNIVEEVTCTIQLPNGFDNGSGELDGSKAQIQSMGPTSQRIVSDVLDLQSPSNPSVLEAQEDGARPE